MADRFNQPLLDAAEVAAGHRVLDLASGAGEPALSAARRVGPTGRVTASDLVPAMLAGARRRVAAAGLDGVAFEIADAEALPFADGSFDRITCRFGIMFFPRPERALAEARRVLKSGGRAAFMVWGAQADNAVFALIAGAVADVFGPDAAAPLARTFGFAAPGSLIRLMTAAGFAEAREQELRVSRRVPVGERFWDANLAMTCAPLLAQDPAKRAAVEAAIASRLPGLLRQREYHLPVHVRIAIGAV
jgi:SAM-dependent methyltransferase